MAEDNENRVETGQASVSDLSDEDLVIIYCLQNKIAKGAIDELLKRGYTSLEALSLVDMSDLVSPKIPRGQRRLTRASEQGLTYTPGQCHHLIHKIVFKI